MKLVIDIPYDMFEQIKRENTIKSFLNRIDFAVRNGVESPHGDCRDRLKEVFREESRIGGDLFHLSQIERIIDGEDWVCMYGGKK